MERYNGCKFVCVIEIERERERERERVSERGKRERMCLLCLFSIFYIGIESTLNEIIGDKSLGGKMMSLFSRERTQSDIAS
jgi:hypothetical protein